MEILQKLTSAAKKHSIVNDRKSILAIAAVGVALMLISQLAGKENDSALTSAQKSSDTADNYCTVTEERLEHILSQVEGVGQAYVMVTLENGIEYRYAADEKQSGDSVFTYASGSDSPSKVQEKEDREQSYILIGSSGDRRPLIVTELSPRIRGVVVVCDGAKNPVIRQRVSEAVTTALGISSLQVCVIQSAI